MSEEQPPDPRSRAQLEAIVFGRGGNVDGPEYERARAHLAQLLDAERPDPPEIPAADPVVPQRARSAVTPRTITSPPEPASRRPLTRRRVSLTALAVIGAVGLLIGGAQLKMLTTTDSMTIFDRPQTERDLALPLEQNGLLAVADSIRYVGSAEGFDAYVYLASATPDDPSACLVIADDETIAGSTCTTVEQFSAGETARVSSGMAWTDISWTIRQGVQAVSGSYPAVQTAITEFDEPQDDEDRAAMFFVTNIREDLQRTARFLGRNSGYSLLAYRGDGDDVCLAVFVPSSTSYNAESDCVTENEFGTYGITILYPLSSPNAQVSWGPEAGTIISVR